MNKRVLIRILFLWLTLINIVNARPLITDRYLDDPEEIMLLRQQARLRAASAAIPCSVNSANPQAVSLPIVNTTGNAVDVFWRDSACVEHKYTTVDNGKMIRQPTYLGQVWVLRDPATGALVNKIKVEGLACSVNNGSAQRIYTITNPTTDQLKLFWRDENCQEHLTATLAPGQSVQQAATMGQSRVLRNSGNLPFRQWVTVPETGSSEAALPPITIVPTSDGGMTIFTDQGSQHITPTPAPATAETPAPVVETSLLATMNLADGRSLSFVIAEVDDSIQSTAIVVGPDNIAVVTVDVAPTADEGQAVVGITVTVDGNVVSKTFDIVTITLPNPQPPPAIPDEDVIDLETPLPPTEESPVPDVAPVPAENTPETSVTPDTPGTPDDSSTVDSTDSSNADSTTSSDSDAASADSSSTSTDGSVGGDGSGAAGDGSASGDGGSAAGDVSAGGDGGSAGGVA